MDVSSIKAKTPQGESMDNENIAAPVQQEQKKPEQRAWYDVLIDIFKKLLETSNFSYGIKKQF